jgi:hypothetical protein
MLNKLFFSLLLILPVVIKAQTKTVNINTTVGTWDSTFVIQSGTTDSFYMGNHPQAGGYSNAEIYICENATLKYSYAMGTSSNPVFYMASGATLKVYGSFNASKVFMKPNSTIECIGGNFLAEEMHRQGNTSTVSVGTLFYDSAYTQINFTFNGWPNNANPCATPNASSKVLGQNIWSVYPNPASNKLHIQLQNALEPNMQLQLIDVLGNKIMYKKISQQANTVTLDVAGLSKGNYYILLQHNNTVVASKNVSIQ